jgi:uncharacterized protein YjiS (DUF1127 family)
MFIHSLALTGWNFVGRLTYWRRRGSHCKELMQLNNHQLSDLPAPEYQPAKWFWRA